MLTGSELTGTGAADRFAAVFDEHAGGLWRYLARQAGAAVAEDPVAETFLVAWEARDDYVAELGSIRSWLYGIAVNLLHRHHRGQARQQRISQRLSGLRQPDDREHDRAAERVDARTRLAGLAAAIADLPDGDRDETVTPVVVAPRRQRWWPRLSAAAAAAAVVAVLAATALHRDGSPPAGAMVEVAQTLNAAADAEIRTVDVTVPPGQFRYIATHAFYLENYQAADGRLHIARTGSRAEIWVPADRKAEWLRRETDTGERVWLVGTAESSREAGIDQSVRPPTELRARCGDWYEDPCDRDADWQSPNDAFLADLPRDPRELFDRLRDDSDGKGNDKDQAVLGAAADALRSGLLPADLRAALYRALALLPGLLITERTATLDGRAGTAYGIAAAGTVREVVIDPATGDFIGERERLVAPMDGMRPGTLIASTSVTYGISPAAGAPPAG